MVLRLPNLVPEFMLLLLHFFSIFNLSTYFLIFSHSFSDFYNFSFRSETFIPICSFSASLYIM